MKPERCLYCDQQGNSNAGGNCGFCENGTPLDTEADWLASWGSVHEANMALIERMRQRIADGTICRGCFEWSDNCLCGTEEPGI